MSFEILVKLFSPVFIFYSVTQEKYINENLSIAYVTSWSWVGSDGLCDVHITSVTLWLCKSRHTQAHTHVDTQTHSTLQFFSLHITASSHHFYPLVSNIDDTYCWKLLRWKICVETTHVHTRKSMLCNLSRTCKEKKVLTWQKLPNNQRDYGIIGAFWKAC